MKKYAFLICSLFLTLGLAVGCSKDKDDEPGDNGGNGGAAGAGICKVDNNSFDLKYCFLTEEPETTMYMFTDTDLFKYADSEGNFSDDFVLSFVAMDFDSDQPTGHPDNLEIAYRNNPMKGTGTGYFLFDESELSHINLSTSGNNVKTSVESVELVGCDLKDTSNVWGTTASFSYDGKMTNVEDYNTKSIVVTKVNDPAQIALLKSLRNKK